MFNLFKKENKQPTDPALPGAETQKITNEKDEDLFDEKTIIYSMPERFRFPHLHAKNAKVVGLLILILGILFLISGSYAVYYYLVKKPTIANKLTQNPIENVQPTSTPPEIAAKQAPVENPVPAGPIVTYEPPSASETATTSASTTTILPENQASSSPLEATSTAEINFISALDQDQDGLSDREETILGTDPNKKDSDDDGYDDLSELKKFYNPAGTGKLDDNQNIKIYENKFNNYRLYYPAEWKSNEVSSDTEMLQAVDNSYIQIIAQSIKDYSSIEDWYLAQIKETYSPDQTFSIENWRGIKSKNGLVSYLITPRKDFVYIISYSPGADNTLYFKNFLDLAISSLVISLGK